jgi:quinolinate synthase
VNLDTIELSQRKRTQAEKVLFLCQAYGVEIFAHFYQRQEVKALAHFVGGSSGIYREVVNSKARAILLCGVSFLAEAIERLRPDLLLLVPRPDAGCPFSETVLETDLNSLKDKGLTIVADLKASGAIRDIAEVILTSAKDLPMSNNGQTTLILPALSAGDPSKVDHLDWPGAVCQVHRQVEPKDVLEALLVHGKAKVVVNSLCLPEVRELADFVGDSQSIWDWCAAGPPGDYLMVSESGLVESLRLTYPQSRFFETPVEIFCPNMKLTNIKDILACLEADQSFAPKSADNENLLEAR